MTKRPLTLRIHPAIYDMLKAQAKIEDVRISNVVQNLIFDHLTLRSDNPEELEQYKVRMAQESRKEVE